MNYYKIGNVFVATIGILDGEQITQAEYDAHMVEVIADLDDPEPTETEVLSILLGGAE